MSGMGRCVCSAVRAYDDCHEHGTARRAAALSAEDSAWMNAPMGPISDAQPCVGCAASQEINATLAAAHLAAHNRLARVRAAVAQEATDHRWHPERLNALAWVLALLDASDQVKP